MPCTNFFEKKLSKKDEAKRLASLKNDNLIRKLYFLFVFCYLNNYFFLASTSPIKESSTDEGNVNRHRPNPNFSSEFGFGACLNIKGLFFF